MMASPRNQTGPPLTVASIGAEWLSVRAGGLNRYTAGLAEGLSRCGVRQRWLVMGDEDLAPAEGVSVEAVAAPTDPLLGRWRAIRRRWGPEQPRPDLATSHFALYAHPVRRRLRSLPHVVHFHGPWADESGAEGEGRIAAVMKRRVERSVYRTADRFVVLSDAFAGVLAERYGAPREKISVVPGGVDVDRFNTGIARADARRRLGWETGRPIVLCVRRLVRRMGLDALITAMDGVRRVHPDALLLIAGRGPLAGELQTQIEQLGLGQNARLLGFLPDEDLPVAYAACDFTIVPTQSLEGFGLIIAESLAAGRPALVTPVGGMPEVVRGLDDGLVLAGASPAELEEGIRTALDGGALPTEDACRSYARDRFDWRAVSQRVLAVYQDAVAAHG